MATLFTINCDFDLKVEGIKISLKASPTKPTIKLVELMKKKDELEQFMDSVTTSMHKVSDEISNDAFRFIEEVIISDFEDTMKCVIEKAIMKMKKEGEEHGKEYN